MLQDMKGHHEVLIIAAHVKFDASLAHLPNQASGIPLGARKPPNYCKVPWTLTHSCTLLPVLGLQRKGA